MIFYHYFNAHIIYNFIKIYLLIVSSYSPKYNIVIINILKHINKYIVSTIIAIFLTVFL